MPSIFHAIILALHATAFTTLCQTAIYAAASPLPLLPTSYLPPAVSPINVTRSLPPSMRIVRHLRSLPAQSTSHATRSEGDPYSQFVDYHQAASKNSRNIKKLAAQSASVSGNNLDFQKKCVTQLNSFRTNVLGQRAALTALTAEKRKPGNGLANYDPNNDLETLFKNTVILDKRTLEAISVLVNNCPILAPVLGPIVYDIKCFLDDILNFCQEFLDAMLNDIQPLLGALVGSTPTAACKGLIVLGLCI